MSETSRRHLAAIAALVLGLFIGLTLLPVALTGPLGAWVALVPQPGCACRPGAYWVAIAGTQNVTTEVHVTAYRTWTSTQLMSSRRPGRPSASNVAARPTFS